MTSNLITCLADLFPSGADLHTPSLGEREKAKILECIDSTFVSSVGPMTIEVERKLCEITASQYAAVTSNGTSALHLCLHALGVGSGDLVIVPSMTFVATANAVLYTGADCLFADIEPVCLGVNPRKLEEFLRAECLLDGAKNLCLYKKTGQPIRALILVHLFGIPACIEELQQICESFCIELIEDAAEALGSYYKGRHVGTFARLAALSFNGNKIVTAGGGGAVLCQDKKVSERIKHLSTTAKASKDFTFLHDEMGFNYRMPNLNAALLLAQLEQLPEFLEKKRRLHAQYAKLLADLEEGLLQTCPKDSLSNYWLNNFILHQEYESSHGMLLEELNNIGIRVRPVWNLMHTLPYLQSMPRMPDLSVAEDYAKRLISLPSSAHLAYDGINY